MAFSAWAALENLASYFGGEATEATAVGRVRRDRGVRGGLFEYLEGRELLAGNPPLVSAIAKSVTENIAVSFSLKDFTDQFNEKDQSATVEAVEILSLPTHGTLKLSGGAVVANETILAANVANLTYTPATGFLGTDTFGYNATDGTNFAVTPSNVTLTVANTEPFVSAIVENGTLNSPFTFTAAEFAAGFQDNDAGDTLQAVTITSLPAHGALTLSGATVNKGEVIQTGSLANLTYTPATGFVGSDSFGWNGSDGKLNAHFATTATVNVPSAFDVLGNGSPIVNGETTPVMLNVTDFGSMTTTPDASLQADTRTYTIKNSTGSAVTIGANAVAISGFNAADFKVVTQPTAGTLAAGASEDFVVQWTPGGVGRRVATVSVASSAGAFVFEVAGTGVATNTIAAPTQSENTGVVQEGTTKSGTGVGAANGEIVGIVYTGYLVSGGKVFDATTLHGGVPLTFRLDNDYADSQPYLEKDQTGNFNNVDGFSQDQSGNTLFGLIPGFEFGLQGLKVGEKRTLVINSDAGYGASGSNGIPGGASLIFDVECVNLVTKPEVAVESTNSAGQATADLLAGQKTTSAKDNTLFSLSNTSSVSQTFKLLTYGTNDATGAAVGSFTLRKPFVKIVGPGAKDFTTSLSNSVLTVTYHPLHPGDKFATVHIFSTDPVHPNYSFAIEGKSAAFADLTLAFGLAKFPTQTITSGTGVTLKVPLVISNVGTSRTAGGSRTNIQIYAFNNSSQTFTLLKSENDIGFGGLAPQGHRQIKITVPVPVTLPTGSYSIFADINQSTLKDGTGNGTLRTLAEVDTTNNGGSALQGITVVQGTYQLTGVIKSSTVTATASAVTGTLSFSVQNTGTVSLPAGQAGTVDIVAHPVGVSDTDKSKDVVLESGAALTLGQLGFGGKRREA